MINKKEEQQKELSINQDSLYTREGAMMENMRIMNAIIREMKEIPELPSEKPSDVSVLNRVEFPPQGGVLTFMDNHFYPYKGFPYFEFVDKIDLIKKISKNIQSGFFHALKENNKFYLLFLAPLIAPVARNLIWAFAYSFHKVVERFKLKIVRYSDAVRELYRVSKLREEKDSQIQDLKMMICDIECMILEFDNAYRYRMQDVFEEVDKVALKKNPVKEIVRLLNIMSDRELLQEQKDKWKLLKIFTSFYMRFDRKFLDMISNILLNVDVEKFKLTKEDKWFCATRHDYIFGFMSNPKSELDKLITKRQDLDKERQVQKARILEESTLVHKELLEKQRQALDLISKEDIKKAQELEKNFLEKRSVIDKEFQEELKKLQDAYAFKQNNLFVKDDNLHPIFLKNHSDKQELDKKYEIKLQELEGLFRPQLVELENKLGLINN